MMRMEGREDLWRSADKVYHVVLCFSLTLVFSVLISRAPSSILRRHSLLLGCSLSLLAGAGKEIADQLGFLGSSGASAKDAVADVLGVLMASILVSTIKFMMSPKSKIHHPV